MHGQLLHSSVGSMDSTHLLVVCPEDLRRFFGGEITDEHANATLLKLDVLFCRPCFRQRYWSQHF